MSLLAEIRDAVAAQIRTANIDSTVNVHSHPPRGYSPPSINVMPGDPYIEYHGSFDPSNGIGRLMVVNLIARVVVPMKQSQESAQRLMDDLLSSGTAETLSVADAITATYTLNGVVAHAYASQAGEWVEGDLGTPEATIPVVMCDIPIVVRTQRS